MDVSQAVSQRISIRAFQETPLREDAVRDWLAAAQRAPSGGNVQPWRVIAVTGAARQAVIDLAAVRLAQSPKGEPTDRPIYPEGLWGIYEARRRRVGEMMYEAPASPREDWPARRAWFANNFRFFGAPVALFFVIDERMGHGQWAHMGMYMQTLALLAVERDWGTCMQECWGMLRPSLKAHFALPESEIIYCGMAVGHPDRTHPVNTLYAERTPLEEVAEFRGF